MSKVMIVYGWTPEYILWKMSLPQFFLWFERAMEETRIKMGIPIDNEPIMTVDEIKAQFKWDEKFDCYVGVD